jgi:gliding motility-associated-like protein
MNYIKNDRIMVKQIFFLAFFLAFQYSFSQGIVVDASTYTVPQLVQNVLFGSNLPSACSGSISNVSWSTGNTGSNGGANGIAYFTNTNPLFPMSSGVILCSGNTTNIPGPNVSLIGDGLDISWIGDNELFNYINGLNIDPTLSSYNDATIIEFDFIPFSNTMSFDFIFASEEYGEYQCEFTDAFAFFLSNITQGTAPINLALIPNTNTPISVVTIRDDAYNSNCNSSNPSYFGIYNGGANAATSATNFDGQTIKMTASSPVTPNETYHIKMVIADRNDSLLDSSVFLEGGSFNIGNTLTLTSAPPTANQTVCVNTSIDSITYVYEGSVTGATVSGLPTGVTATVLGNTVTISGTPTINSNTPYVYTITTTGGICGSSSMSGTITVTNGITSAQLTSAPTTSSQSVCNNTSIVPITYALQGGAINAVVTGLPLGVTANINNSIVTIDGTPSVSSVTSYSYTITPSGASCGTLASTGTLTVNSVSSPTGASAQNFCNAAFISDLIATGSTLQWYDEAIGGNILSTTTSLVNGLTYYATQTVSGCESSVRLPVEVNIVSSTTPIGTSTQTFCNSATIADLVATGTTIKWYSTPTGGTSLSSTSQLVNGATYYATQTINSCESSERLPVTITINTPSAPTGASIQTFCNSATIADLVATGSNIKWYANAAGGIILPLNTPIVDGVTYYASQTVNGCENPERLSVEVDINQEVTPTFESVPPICYGDFIAALPPVSIEGISGIWSPSINNTQTTTYTFSPSSGTCINSATMTILVSAIPPGNQPGPLYYCDPNNDGFGVFDLTQVIPIVIGQNDMDVSFHETVTDAENDLTFIPNPSNYYNISVDNQTIYIRVESTDQSVFVTGTGSYVGGVFSSFPPGLQINPVDGTISPTNSTPGSYTVTYTTPASPNCPSTTSTTVVTITELPSASISYNDLPFCTSSNFQPVNLVGSGGVFSSTSGISIDAITGTVNPSESIPGTYIVTYTIPASGGCEEVITSTQVTINDSPKAQISYSNPSFCVSVNTTQLPVLTGSDSSTASYLGGVYIAGVGLNIDSVTGEITPSISDPGVYTVTYSTNIDPANPNCPPVIATTQVTINPLPTASISYASPFCSTDISKIVNLVGSGGTFSSTTGLTIDAVNGTIFPSLSNPGTYTVSYIIPANNGCSAVTATTVVTITPAPSATISYSNSPFCKSINTPQIPAVNGSSGGVFSSSAGLSIVSSSGAITPASSTIGNYSVLYTVAASGGCPAYTTSSVVAVNSIIAPIVNCGVSDNNSVSFIWDAIQGVDNYSVSYQINSGANINVGQIGNVQSYSIISLNPLDVVTITVTPIAIDPNNTCYTSSSGTCTATNCVPSTATINYPDSPFCSTSTMMEPVTISGNSSGTFSSTTGLTIDANTGAINPSTSSIGQYTVSYTIPSGPNCPPYITTAIVVINGGPIATISYLNPIFCKSLSTIQPVTLTGNTGGTFSSTVGLAIDPITGEIQPSGSVVGNYTVNYTIPATGGCQAVVVSTQVEIIDSPMASISYPSPICSNDTTPRLVTLTGTSGGIFTSSAGLTIDPNTGTITPNTSIPGTYTITYTIPAANGCDEVIANADVAITDTLSSPIITCGTSTLNSVTFLWDPVTGVDNYFVSYQVGSVINNVGSVGTNLNYTISNLNPGDLVTITITPSNSLNIISCLDSAEFTCSSLNCSINEIQITPTVITTNSVQFNWNPIQNATAYWLIYQVNGNINTIGMINSTNYTISNLNPGDIINITISASIDGVNYFCQSQGNAVIPSCNPTSSSISYSSAFYCKSSPIICHKILTLELIVNPTPEATEPADYHVCDDNYDGFATFNLASISPEVLGTINPVTNSINYYTSIADAQSNSNPINNLTNFINTTINTQTLWIRIETIATGCFDIVTLQLVVDPLPNATQPNYPPYTLCDNDQTNLGFETFDLGSKINDILLGQNGMSVNFYFSQADALSDNNALPLLYVNSAIYVQTLWIRIENVITGCFVLSTMDIRIEPLPSPIPPSSPYTICDGNQDGFSSFDLNTLTSDILQGANYTITYHETFTNAQLGSNSLVSPYDNLNPFIQFIYASALDNVNGCRSVIPIELNVEPKPKMPTNIPPIVQCDEDNNSQDLTMLFDLTQITPIILAVQDMAASNYTVTYYISEADAIAGLAPIIQSTAYTGTNNQIIWVRVENNASQCFAIGSFILSVNPPLFLTTPLPLNICDNDASPNNQYTVFDLTVRNNAITQGQPNMTVTYYPSYPVTASSIAIANPTSYTNVVPAVQTLGVMVTNAQGCRSYTSLDIRVLPIPTPRTIGINPLTSQCDDNLPGDMLEVFDLTTNAAFIINGDLTLTLHYYPTQADALADTNEILNPTAALVGNNVWIRVENNRVDYQGNNCYVLVEQPLTVNPLPIIVQPLAPYRACDDNTDGIAVFDLTNAQLAIAILGATQLPANYTISYYLTAAGANPLNNTGETPLPNNYTNVIPNAETIYIRVVNNTTGCVNTGILPLAVEPYATATGPQTFNQCDSYADPYDGVELIDLTTYAPAILNGQDPTIFLVSYYTSLADAQAGTNALTLAEAQAYQTDADTDTIWVKVENSSNLITPFCNAITTIAITIEPLPEPIISSPTNNICVDYATNVLLSGLTLNSGLTTPNYTFVWSLDGTVIPGATASTYDITTVAPGDYTVVATSTSSLACVSNVSNTFTVIQSGPAQLSDPAYTVSNPFDDNQVIVVNVVGFGQYEFSLDDGPFQINNIFENVSLGSHTITIRDVEGNTSCGEIVIDDVQTINYPHYFTPNGDGIHDTWNVVGLENEPRAKLYIFDRYGKLLKQLSTTGNGWDGTYNGYLLPSTDYWFRIEFPNLKSEWKEFKSHFSLKR